MQVSRRQLFQRFSPLGKSSSVQAATTNLEAPQATKGMSRRHATKLLGAWTLAGVALKRTAAFFQRFGMNGDREYCDVSSPSIRNKKFQTADGEERIQYYSDIDKTFNEIPYRGTYMTTLTKEQKRVPPQQVCDSTKMPGDRQ